jgi:hypothetical protein
MRMRIAVATAAIGIAGVIAIAIAWTRTPADVEPEDDGRDERSRDLEARGRRALDAGRTDEALVQLADAYELADRATTRFLLARAFGAHGARGTIADTSALTSLSPDGALLAIAHDTELAVWTTEPARRTGQLALTAPVGAIAWNPKDPTQLVVAGAAGAQFYDVTRGRASVIEGVPGRIEQLAWGMRARAAIDQGGKFSLADLSPPRESLALAARPVAITAAHALVCAEVCEIVSINGEIEIPIAAQRAVFADDRVAIASATEVVVVDLLGREVARVEGSFTEIALTGDGTRLATSAGDETQIRDAESGDVLEVIAAPMRALSRDGAWLATQTATGLQLWQLGLERRTPAEVQAIVRARPRP